MENNNEQKECKCMCWGHHEGCRKHVWLRWILGIAILVFVFSMGVKLGELKELFRGDYGYGGGYGCKMMRGGYADEFPVRYNMMQYRVLQNQQNQVVPQDQNKIPAGQQ